MPQSFMRTEDKMADNQGESVIVMIFTSLRISTPDTTLISVSFWNDTHESQEPSGIVCLINLKEKNGPSLMRTEGEIADKSRYQMP
jgi:hypothetical protein